jgi:hypothetical protein
MPKARAVYPNDLLGAASQIQLNISIAKVLIGIKSWLAG